MTSGKDKTKVLFLCVHNSGRSQIAEEYLKRIGGSNFEVESAGLQPTDINPFVLEVMKEDGFDLSEKKTQSAWELFKAGRMFRYVITVCDRAHEEECPLFPRPFLQLNWPFPDPRSFTGTEDERIQKTRQLRDSIKARVEQFVADLSDS